jgi:hypothetical protein
MINAIVITFKISDKIFTLFFQLGSSTFSKFTNNLTDAAKQTNKQINQVHNNP